MLVVGGMLALGACGLQSVPSSAAAPTPTATATATAAPSVVPSTAAEATPVVKKRTVTETRVIPFKTRKVNDPALAKGTTKVRTRGRTGVKTLTYEVTLTNGVQTDKRLVRGVVTSAPVTRVLAVGTRNTRQCDPNYSGGCVPIASDVDCAGGSGNGPAYVRGPVRVVGTDIYDLDRDGDGIACDS
ncbi:G5 domain-containing protein [Actinomadura sp. HBU206391]|uniref:G5 domain-containing protein n=1 Tax=Actinomadura sp. HBU206391 TaxID=2731692 RepID=UPI001C9BC9EA|nr:G5 domain-containing protein [Actinomadura sp. HBU206391]